MTWVGVGQNPCAVCGNEGQFHVTVKVELAGEKTTRMKVVQFWLCESCEVANQQVMAHDDSRQKRVALRLTDYPSFMSYWRDWRGKKFWSPQELQRQAEFDQNWEDKAIRERAKSQAQAALETMRRRRDKI